jgi:cytosine/adenosine deaminase-related metal-dependent hydrolase
MFTRAIVLLLALVACDPKSDSDPDADSGGQAEADADTDTDTDTDTDADSDSGTDCGNDLESPSTGICDVAGGSGSALLLRGNVLTASDVLLGGEVLIDADGDIVCAACDCSESDDYASATTVTCADGVISPGLINPHDHIGYTEGAPIEHGTTRYDHRHDWRGSLSTPSNSSSLGYELGEVRMIMGGTTSMVGSGYADGLVRNLDEYANEGLDIDPVDNQTFPLGDSNESFQEDCDWDYRETEREVAEEDAYLPHIAEGIDDYAAEEFRCSSTSFDGAQDFTESNAAHVHSIGLSTEDYYRMALEETGIVWSPRSNISLYGHTAQVTTFHQLGGVISLGTDWTYSGSIHSVRELACADLLNSTYYDGHFSDRELWEMVTVNGALATGTEDLLGTLAEDRVADVTIFNGTDESAFRAIIEAEAEDVVLVLRAGEPLYGEADTLEELGKDCEEVEVCGSEMAICADQEFGASYDEIIDEAAGDYDAFYCGPAPYNEPTCVPSRPDEFDGEPTSDDADGDGIADADDNCPRVFNPIRPMDDDVQPDADGDGEGDACDPTPLPDDLDGDGVDDADDNCPFDDNDDQDDGDGDDKGDECDPCPEQSNPDSVCALDPEDTTIYDVQTGAVSEGTYVRVTDVVVTSVTSSGFTAQDPDLKSSPEYSGIYIYTSSDPGVARGDVVEVEGEVGEYYDWTQIQTGEVTVTTSAGTGTCDEESGDPGISPVSLTVEQATDEAYESVLVTLSDGTVTDEAYDCSVDGKACVDTDLWEIDSSSGLVVYDFSYECSDWTDHVGEVPVTGVMMYRWERRRITPRLDSDFGG